MSELWGLQSGISQRQADDQSKGLYDLRMAEGVIDIQTKQLTYQNASLMQSRQEQAIKMMQLANSKQSQGSVDHNPTAEVTDTLMNMANIDFQAGLPEQGLAAVKSAVSLQANHSKIVEQTTMDQIRHASYLSNLLTDVHDQASWDNAKMIFQANFPGSPIPPEVANKPYSAAFIKQVAAGSTTALQTANAKLAATRTGEVAANTELAKARVPWVASQTKLNNTREELLRKNGGENALPKAANVADVRDMITEAYPDIGKDDAGVMARRVAADAKKMVDKDGLDPLTANRRAFNKAKESGVFFGLKPGRIKGGTSTKNPLTVPLKSGKPDLSAMTDNMIYDGAAVGHPGEFYAFDKARGGLVHIAAGDTSEETDDEGADDSE